MCDKKLKIDLDRLTEYKAASICESNDYEVKGVVMRDKDGRVCVVELSAVRWIEKDYWWDIMHPGIRTDEEMIRSLLDAASCPCCDGGGAYYDNNGEVTQCQWCYEKDQIMNRTKNDKS